MPEEHGPDARIFNQVRIADRNIDSALVKRQDQSRVFSFKAAEFDIR
jgi:hypothetical protein